MLIYREGQRGGMEGLRSKTFLSRARLVLETDIATNSPLPRLKVRRLRRLTPLASDPSTTVTVRRCRPCTAAL
jgi:hypothetical protein